MYIKTNKYSIQNESIPESIISSLYVLNRLDGIGEGDISNRRSYMTSDLTVDKIAFISY